MFVGPLLILTTISERIMGNLGCSLFAVFWLSFGFLPLPTPRLAAANPPTGTDTIESAVFALFTCFIFTLKTNTVSALIFLFTATSSWVLAGA
jgi:hypothetical protein